MFFFFKNLLGAFLHWVPADLGISDAIRGHVGTSNVRCPVANWLFLGSPDAAFFPDTRRVDVVAVISFSHYRPIVCSQKSTCINSLCSSSRPVVGARDVERDCGTSIDTSGDEHCLVSWENCLTERYAFLRGVLGEHCSLALDAVRLVREGL